MTPTASRRLFLLLSALALSACDGAPPPPWSSGLETTAQLYVPLRGLSIERGIIHLHSVYSHDACDGMPEIDGAPNAVCNQRLRDALCATHQDFAMLTDHATLMADTDWDALFLPQAGDEVVTVGGRHVASRLACPDGTSTLAMIGGENELMPIGMDEHAGDTPEARRAVMGGSDAAAVAAMRAHGALVLIAHGESHAIEQMREVAPEAIEIYNVHANLGPDIRNLMGLDPAKPLTALAPFLGDRTPVLESDLAFLAFVEENTWELEKFVTLLSEGRHVAGTLGTDAHENAVPIKMRDGDRGDSYRRLMRWFSNHALVADREPASLKEAIGRGRFYGAFEILGAPVGFDYHAEVAGVISEMGETVRLADSPTLLVVPPTPAIVSNAKPAEVRTRILRIDASGEVEVASQSGASPLSFPVDARGAYRVEVRITPHHLRGYMGKLADTLTREYVWVYANPIYVE